MPGTTIARKMMLGLCMACSMALMQAAGAAAETLSSTELAAKLSGKTWAGTKADSTPFWITWAADGSFCLKVGSNDEGQSCELSGTWWQDGSDYCMRPEGGEWEQCLQVSDAGGGSFESVLEDGSVDFTWTVVE